MIEIAGRTVSADLLTECFACDLSRCRGACCVEGEWGAPLENGEADILKREYESYASYMTEEGRAAVARDGFSITDPDGDDTTTLLYPGGPCAYAYINNGLTLCAVEAAYEAGRTLFRKPVSCHLYPLRTVRFSDGSEGLQYHRWSVCGSAARSGLEKGIPLYIYLREPITRRFGPEFYDELCAAARFLQSHSKK